jgi:hypothetical protein
MLIKLGGGVKADLEEVKQELKVGSPVLRYVLNESYDKGEVVEIEEGQVVVDFVDTVRKFDKLAIGLVYGNGKEEHWAVFEEGTVLKDFRGKAQTVPKIEKLEDLLDFDKWMV